MNLVLTKIRRKNISRLACRYISLINDVVTRNTPDLERMLDLHQKIFDLNEENGWKFLEYRYTLCMAHIIWMSYYKR